MRTAASKMGALCLVAGLLTGCETMGEWADATGETLGGWADATGETVGGWYDSAANAFSSDRHYIARQVGSDLEERDAKAIGQKSAEALEWTPAGKSVRWSNPKTGTRAVITPGKKQTKKLKVQTARKKGVAAASGMVLIGRTYTAKKNANVRAAPNTSSRIVGGLAKGERFTAIAEVKGGKWIMVGVDGKAIGYVFDSLVTESKKTKRMPELREVLDLEDRGLGRDVVVDRSTVATACRTVNYRVTMRGGESTTERFRACKAGDGAWEIN